MKQKSLNVLKIKHRTLIRHLKNPKIYSIYKNFIKNISQIKKFKSYAVALSGGPDSMALAFLIKCYSLKKNKKIFFYHVDHKLRQDSADEAILLKKRLNSFDINLKILNWNGKKPKSNIQSAARNKRYELILKEMIKENNNILLLGHTRDDLLENFFIRIMRGSGLEGFVSFNKLYLKKENINISRPLLTMTKKQLIFVTKSVFNFYIVDKSNKNLFYKRARVRKLLDSIKSEGFNLDKLFLTINNLTYSNDTIKFYTDFNVIKNCRIIKKNNSAILNKDFFYQPNEIIFRSLTKILSTLSKKYYYPRGKKIMLIIDELKNNKASKKTIHGFVVEKLANSVIIYPEIKKIG